MAEEYVPDFTDPKEALVDLSELFENQLEDYYTKHDLKGPDIKATDNPTGFVADFPGDRKLNVSMAVTNGTEPENSDQKSSNPYVYMDTIFINKRKDEWVASCMVHTDDATDDVTVEASHNTPEKAREKLRRYLSNMDVTPQKTGK